MTCNLGRCFLLAMTCLVSGAAVAVAQPPTGPLSGTMGGGGPSVTGGALGSGSRGMIGSSSRGLMDGTGRGLTGGNWDAGTYLDGLEAQLAITLRQEPAWQEYAATVSDMTDQLRSPHQMMSASTGATSWEQRRDQMNAMLQVRRQAIDAVHAAAIKLISVLDPAQATKAHLILPGLGY